MSKIFCLQFTDVVDSFLVKQMKSWIIDQSFVYGMNAKYVSYLFPSKFNTFNHINPNLLGHCLSSPLLLQRLALCKSQSHPLSHFDIPFGAMLYTRSFILVKTFRTKWRDAVGEAFGDKVVVKSVWFEPLVVASQTCFGWGNGWWNVSFVLK